MFPRNHSFLSVWVGLAAAALVSFAPEGQCAAGQKEKEECVDAHSRGQDLRDKGQLTRARQLFLSCAQSACPSLLQGDCARYGEDVERMVPTVTFGARDSSGGDLPDTKVFLDDVQVATRLDDGKSYDLDPGNHTVRWVHGSREVTQKVVVNSGEKGRTLVATFPSASGGPGGAPSSDASTPGRSALPLVVAGIGAAAAAGGGALVAVGMSQVPATCSADTHECAAPPGDPVFSKASEATSMANAGVAMAIGGSAILVGGIVWYFVQPTSSAATTARLPMITPVFGPGHAGAAGTFRF